jgi:IS66 Orf2 like protein
MIIDLPVRPGLRILVTSRPVDFRRGMDSLSTLVKETLATDPYAGDVFVFRAKRAQLVSLCSPLSESGQADDLIVLIILIESWPAGDHALHSSHYRF